MFLGWYDPDKKRTVREKVDDAIDRYRDKFNREPVAALMNPADAEAMLTDGYENVIDIQGRHFIPRSTFYVGIEEQP